MPRAHKASVEGKKRKRDERDGVRVCKTERREERRTIGGEGEGGRITDEEKEREREGEKRAYGPHLPIARGW